MKCIYFKKPLGCKNKNGTCAYQHTDEKGNKLTEYKSLFNSNNVTCIPSVQRDCLKCKKTLLLPETMYYCSSCWKTVKLKDEDKLVIKLDVPLNNPCRFCKQAECEYTVCQDCRTLINDLKYNKAIEDQTFGCLQVHSHQKVKHKSLNYSHCDDKVKKYDMFIPMYEEFVMRVKEQQDLHIDLKFPLTYTSYFLNDEICGDKLINGDNVDKDIWKDVIQSYYDIDVNQGIDILIPVYKIIKDKKDLEIKRIFTS